MSLDFSKSIDSVRDGIVETARITHEKTKEFHANYVSKVVPEFGKYGDAARFAAEMVPGVAEYNAINEGDWKAFAIAAGIDVGAVAVGLFTAGTGYAAAKGGTATARSGVRVATREVAEAGVKKAVRETAEAGTEKIIKGAVEAGTEKITKEMIETGVVKATKEVVEESAKRAAIDLTEEGVETTVKEAAEKGAEKTVLKVGDIIKKTDFPRYIDEVERITKREIQKPQRELLDKALKENDYAKLSAEATRLARWEFGNSKGTLIKEWEKRTGDIWPRYTEDVLNEAGQIVRRAGQPYDAHHIIELSVNGPNKWWNLHPASFPVEHQNLIHGAESMAKKIFG